MTSQSYISNDDEADVQKCRTYGILERPLRSLDERSMGSPKHSQASSNQSNTISRAPRAGARVHLRFTMKA